MRKKMLETVFNTNPTNSKNQYMFFGDTLNIARDDMPKHIIFKKLTTQQRAFEWNPEEIDLGKDIRDFKILSDTQKHIFTKNISFQILMDSVQARGPGLALLPFVSLSELESCILIWQKMEMVHNLSYRYLLENIYTNPSEVFDNIIKDHDIILRSKSVTKYYDEFIKESTCFRAREFQNEESTKQQIKELKTKLLLCMASINILEGLSFYVSFACSFAFAEQGLMEGNAKILSLIARDEALHLAITQNIFKKWGSNEDDPDMVKIYQECLSEIESMFYAAIEIEKQWSTYLFKDGSMIGLSENILNQYVEYIAGKRMKNLGIKHNFISKNPLSWTDKYLKSSDLQVAPQEVELSSYTMGGIKNDLEDTDFNNIGF